MIDQARRLLPGILVCIAITIAATLLQGVEVAFVGQPYLEALVLAILLGVALRTVWTPTPRWQPGINFSGKFVLECAIVMLGAAVSVSTIAALGPSPTDCSAAARRKWPSSSPGCSGATC